MTTSGIKTATFWLVAQCALLKDKDIPVTGCGGPQGYETSRFPHFLDNRLTRGGEVTTLKFCPQSVFACSV
jgi:hypothetical protein